MSNASLHNTTAPLVTVAIPCFNASATIEETINSVCAQTYPHIEIIVVDDGSSDNTRTILDQYQHTIIVIAQANGGLAKARNAALQRAQGKYIALLDADDVCLPERIAIQVQYMEENENIVLCSSDFSTFSSKGALADSFIASYYSIIATYPNGLQEIYGQRKPLTFNGQATNTYHGHVYDQIALGNFIHPPTVLFRRHILQNCGLFDEKINNCCDFEWFIRVSRQGELGFIDRPLINYRLSASQMSGPSNHIQISLDTINIVEQTIASDPKLYARQRHQFRKRLGKYYLFAAQALTDTHAFLALGKLLHSFMYGEFSMESVKVALKILLPKCVTTYKRSVSLYSPPDHR